MPQRRVWVFLNLTFIGFAFDENSERENNCEKSKLSFCGTVRPAERPIMQQVSRENTPIVIINITDKCIVKLPLQSWHIIQPALRAESARAVTGRRCPHSGKGEDFLTGQLIFFTKTAVTLERKVEKSFPMWEINRHAEG